MRIERIKDKTSFGIYKGHRLTSYGEYTWGIYKGKKIEVFDAKKHQQKLIYVSHNKLLKWIKSKLTYIQDGIKKINRSEAR
jgi:hypothetical protein